MAGRPTSTASHLDTNDRDDSQMETQEAPIIKYFLGVPVVMRPKKGNLKGRQLQEKHRSVPTPPPSPQSPLDADPRFPRDRYFDSNSVVALTEYNFDEYIGPKQKALIMFYDVNKCSHKMLTHQFAEASDKSLDFHYGFGAVDCFYDTRLCERENVNKTPMLKLYSNGFEVSSINFPEEFNADRMHMLMKMTPILTQSRQNMGKDIVAAKAELDNCTPPRKRSLWCAR